MSSKKYLDINDLGKAQSLLTDRLMPLNRTAEKSRISYNTIRQYASHPGKLKKASWGRIHKLALIYDDLVSELTKWKQDYLGIKEGI